MNQENIKKCFIGLFDILGYKNIVQERDISEIFRLDIYLKNETQDSLKH